MNPQKFRATRYSTVNRNKESTQGLNIDYIRNSCGRLLRACVTNNYNVQSFQKNCVQMWQDQHCSILAKDPDYCNFVQEYTLAARQTASILRKGIETIPNRFDDKTKQLMSAHILSGTQSLISQVETKAENVAKRINMMMQFNDACKIR